MLLVDTNVLLDILEDDPQWAPWSIGQLRNQAKLHELGINPIIYAELSLAFALYEDLDDTIAQLGLVFLELPRAALFLAGRAFLQYKRAGGAKHNVLADFLIGAHAASQRMPLLTRDTQRYKSYFPSVTLISPSSGT
jgi:predicted nucleic acid-binding protein